MAREAHEFDALSAIAAGAYRPAPAARVEAGEAELQARQYFEPEQALATQAAALDALDACGAIVTPSATGPAPKGFETAGIRISVRSGPAPATPTLNPLPLSLNGLPPHVQLVGRAFNEGRRFKVAATLLLGTSASSH